MSPAKRKGTKRQVGAGPCVNWAACGRKAKVGPECWGCYRTRTRDEQRTTPKRVQDDLGPDKGRIAFDAPGPLRERFHAAVPESQRSGVLRRLLEAAYPPES